VDCPDEVEDTPECAAADWFPGDFRKPPFDLVEPGGTGGCEVHVITGSCCQPFAYLRMLMSSVVVENQVNRQLSIDRLVDPIEKVEKLLVPMPRLAFAITVPSRTFSAANSVVVPCRS
jgi:hypothetical protein